jgi:hypothetical protein
MDGFPEIGSEVGEQDFLFIPVVVAFDDEVLVPIFLLYAKRRTRSIDRDEVPLVHWRLRSGVWRSPELHLRLRTFASR